MIRKIKILIALFLVYCTTIVAAQVGMSIHDSTFVQGTVNIPLYVDSSLTGLNVTSFKLQFTFSQYSLTIDSVITAGTISQGWGNAFYNKNNTGRLDIAAAGSTPLSGSGILLFIKVTALNGGSWFSFTDTLNNYFNEGSPKMILNNGYFNISALPSISIYPYSGLLTVGETLQFQSSGGKAPYTWSVTNPAVAKIDSNGLLTSLGMGFTKIVAKDSSGLIDTISGTVEIRPFKLSFGDTSFYQGQTVEIPIYTTNLNGLNVSSGQFTLSFNGGILSPVNIITSGTLTQNFATPSFSYTPANGQMNISFAGNSSLSGSGILFYINFQITKVNGGGTGLSLSNILFNQNLPGNSLQGYFNVISLSTLYISPNTASLVRGDTLRFYASGGTPPYRYYVSDSSLASIDSTGLLRAIKGGIVTVSAKDVFGGSGISGNINLYDTKLSIPDTSVSIGSTFDIPVSVGSMSNSFNISSLQTTLIFDSSVVKFDQIVTIGTLTNGWSYQINNEGNKIILAAAGSGSFNSVGVVFKIQFIISTAAQVNSSTSVSLQQFLFNEGLPIPEIKNGSITVSSGTIPSAPSNLITTANGPSIINLNWVDNSNNEIGFKIERSLDTLSGYSLIQTLAANSTSYSDTGLVDGTKYFYRVYSYNSSGNSGYSNIASSITTLNAPTNLSVTDSSKPTLSWTNNSTSAQGFIIERKTSGGNYAVIDTVNSNITMFVDSSVTAGLDYFYRIKAFNNLVQSTYSNEVSILITKIFSGLNNIIVKFDLLQNYPNPFNPSTIIKYDIPKTSFVSIKIFNLLGKEVATIVNEEKLPGEYSITFNADNISGSGRNLSSGVYFYEISAGSFFEAKKFVLLK